MGIRSQARESQQAREGPQGAPSLVGSKLPSAQAAPLKLLDPVLKSIDQGWRVLGHCWVIRQGFHYWQTHACRQAACNPDQHLRSMRWLKKHGDSLQRTHATH